MPALKNVPALVTGAGRGIGRAIAERLAAEGAAVTLLARTQTEIDAVAAGIRARGAAALALACDVTQPGEVAGAFAAASEHFGPVRLLVNNAGTPGPFGPIGVVDPQEWWRSQHLHQYAPLLTMSAVIPAMQRAGGGRIINIVSSAGTRPVLHMSGYALGKCAAIRITETVDLEQRGNGIRAFALQPGTIITDMAHATLGSADAQRWIPEGIAMLNARTPEQSAADLARCCAVVAALAAGHYDALSGRYLDIAWDLDALARDAAKTP
jgi:NAD(P)-dependent dehydrogenase (short-subunit alcohol dehydrogenase family)